MISSDTGPFTIIPDWVLRLPLSDRAVRLYAVLGRFADGEGACNPSRKRLAERARCSLDSVDRAKDELVAAGALRYEQAKGGGQHPMAANRYVLVRINPAGGAAPLRQGVPQDGGTGCRSAAAVIEREPIEREPENERPARSERRKPKVRFPESFALRDQDYEWAEVKCPHVDVSAETASFATWWRADGGIKADWYQAWRNWMGKAEARAARQPTRRFA